MNHYLYMNSAILSGLTASLVFSGLGMPVATAAEKAPNILWIITDDHRPDTLVCYNEAVSGTEDSPLGYVSSPYTDKLADEGVLFTRAYSNSPSCAPSRASMFTGQYPFRNGVYGFETWRRMDFVQQMIPEVMTEEGYNTVMVGKLDVRMNRKVPPGKGETWFDTKFDAIIDRSLIKGSGPASGLDHAAVMYTGKDGRRYRKERFYVTDEEYEEVDVTAPGGLSPEQERALAEFDKSHDYLRAYQRKSGPYLIIGGETTRAKGEDYHGFVNQYLFDYLEHPNREFTVHVEPELVFRGPDPSKPVFANLGYEWPHTPVLPPKEFRDQFKDIVYKIPEFDKAELKKLPPQLTRFYDRFGFDEMTYEEKQQAIRDYFAFCAYGDWLIGRAVEEFKKYSEAQSRPWVIIYTVGDHSWHMGENGVMGKFGPYDMSNRCAIIAVSSDKSIFPAGVVCDDLVEFVDLAPTFYDLAGVDLLSGDYAYLDGYSLMDILDGSEKREYVLNETNHVYEHRASIRNEDFVFSMRTRPKGYLAARGLETDNIRWALEAPDKEVEMALFDLRADPLERTNVANDEEYRELAQWFRQKLGSIVLGDRRVEYNWTRWRENDQYAYYDFALGSDDKELAIPAELIP